MRKGLFFLVSVLILGTSCGRSRVTDQITFAAVDPMTKVLREMNFFGPFTDTMNVARGETATFQFAVRSALPIEGLTAKVTFSNGDSTLQNITVGFVEYARVGNPTPNAAKDAIVSPSGYYPDPVFIVPSIDVKRDITQPIWIRVDVPKTALPGLYSGTITIGGSLAGDKFEMTDQMNLRVYPVVLNEPSLMVTNWYSMDPKVTKHFYGHDVELYSQDYWNILEAFAEKMAYCYQNMALISPVSLTQFTLQDGKYSFDFTNFDRTVELFEKAGIDKRIEGGHLGSRAGDWMSPFIVNVPVGNKPSGEVITVALPAENDSTKTYIAQFIPALVAHLKDKGWYDKYMQHIADEPIGGASAASYVAISKLVKAAAPDIKIIEACHSKDLENIIDVWVPQLDYYSSDNAFYQERQKAGDEVWFYTCLAPQGQFANRFLDQPLIKTRLLHWINYKYGATGYLHWGLAHWGTDDPYNQTTLMNTEGGNTLPGGDCWIVYPDNGTLHGSIRLDAMRDGIADYELLKMLALKDKTLADELCRQTIFNWTLYNTEPGHLRKTRRTILEKLSE